MADNDRIDELEQALSANDVHLQSVEIENRKLREALETLYEEADGFSVSGVYFSEPCHGHKGLEMARKVLWP